MTIVADQTATVTLTKAYDHPAAGGPDPGTAGGAARGTSDVLAASGVEHRDALAVAAIAVTLGAGLQVLTRGSTRSERP